MKKKNVVIDAYSGKSKYIGKGRKRDIPVEAFDDYRDSYWTKAADKILGERNVGTIRINRN